MNILFVDDNELNRMVLEEMLEIIFPDISVEVYASADEVLKLQLDKYDMILSDINMPKIDGLALFTMLREEYHYTKPIIAVTALAVTGDRERMLMHGFDDFVSKPINMDELQSVIEKYI